ncbi:hypothetical protein ACFVTJ_16990 [Agrobacterium sp. NPDC058088]|uniref:hypothetical protein n=1 Tax=Agrobacterium sp. NPDC058088 TaxID=3346335 RepID=UPI0036D9D47E
MGILAFPEFDGRELHVPGVLSFWVVDHFDVLEYVQTGLPSHLKQDDGKTFAYVRPIATIEPTVIANGPPVETAIGYHGVDALVEALAPVDHEARVTFVAWEQKTLVKAAKSLMKVVGGNPGDAPKWPSDDFDSLYILKLPDNEKTTLRTLITRIGQPAGQMFMKQHRHHKVLRQTLLVWIETSSHGPE